MSETARSDNAPEGDRLRDLMDRVRERNLSEGNILTEGEPLELTLRAQQEVREEQQGLDA
jgi:hypothetical protein